MNRQFLKRIRQSLLINCQTTGKPGVCAKEWQPPSIGDKLKILGQTNEVVDFGHWTDISKKYPSSVKRVLESLPTGMNESHLGRTWVLKGSDGDHYLVGKAGLKLFTGT